MVKVKEPLTLTLERAKLSKRSMNLGLVRLRRQLAILCCFVNTCAAGETIYLRNGFCLQAESHEQSASGVLLRTLSGTVELQLSEIDRIEIVPAEPASNEKARSGQPDSTSPRDLLDAAARAEGLPPEFVKSVAKIESSLRQSALSPKGALGLMQLMPATAAELGVDPAKAKENAEGGARYLRQLLVRYHYDSARALAAYNAGPGAVLKAGGVPPIAETVRYVQRVLGEYARQQSAQQKLARAAAPRISNKPTAID